jgi:hypothetical protein
MRARLRKCYEVLIQEAAFFFQSQSQLFFFAPRASCTFGCAGPKLLLSADAFANFHAHLFFARRARSRVTPEKIFPFKTHF